MIRLATVEDIPQLINIELHSFKHGNWGRSQFWRLIQHGKGKFWVSEFICSKRISGYIYVTPKGRILSVAAMGKCGFGTNLLRHAEKHFSQLHLEVCVSNKKAIRLYEYLGYIQYGHKTKYYENGEDALLFRKELKHVQPRGVVR